MMVRDEDVRAKLLEEHLKRDRVLLANIKRQLPELESLLEEVNSHWGYEDPIYRFYHRSLKVYAIQQTTQRMIKLLKSLAPPGATISADFEQIYKAGASGKEFEMEHNKDWTKHTRVFLEAFFHAKYFLEMAVKVWQDLGRSTGYVAFWMGRIIIPVQLPITANQFRTTTIFRTNNSNFCS